MKLKKFIRPFIFIGSTVAFAILFLPKITKKKTDQKKGTKANTGEEAV